MATNIPPKIPALRELQNIQPACYSEKQVVPLDFNQPNKTPIVDYFSRSGVQVVKSPDKDVGQLLTWVLFFVSAPAGDVGNSCLLKYWA